MITIKMNTPNAKTATIYIPRISGFIYETHPKRPELSPEEQESNNKLQGQIKQYQAYILEQYSEVESDVTAIKFSSNEYLGMSTDLLGFAIENLLPQINDVEIDLKKVGYDFVNVIPNTPSGVHTLRLHGDFTYGRHEILKQFLSQPKLSKHIKHLDMSNSDLPEIFQGKKDILGVLSNTLESLDVSNCGLERVSKEYLTEILKPLPKNIKKLICNGVVDKDPYYQPLYRDKPNSSPWDNYAKKERLFLTVSEMINCTPDSVTQVEFTGKASMRTSYSELHGESNDIPTRILQLNLSYNRLGSQSLENLYSMFMPYMSDKNRAIEIVADEKLYASLQAIINFEKLLLQVAEYVKNNPKQVPSPHNPIRPSTQIEKDTAIQYINLLKSRDFEAPYYFAAKLTLALLFSGGIVNDYANNKVTGSEKFIMDKAKAAAYMGLWQNTHSGRTPELRQQTESLIKELGLEYDISTQRQDLVKKYCSQEQNELAELIDYIIVNEPLNRLSDDQILANLSQLISQLKSLPHEQLNNSGKMLQILEQMHYMLNVFFKNNHTETSINSLVRLFEDNKSTLKLLDHKDLIAKCTEAHTACLKANDGLLEQDIPSTPSEELLLGVYVKILLVITNSIIINQFRKFSKEANNISISVNNISVDSVHGYMVWDKSISNHTIPLLLTLFYAGIIVCTNTQSSNQINLRKALDSLNAYATIIRTPIALRLLHYIVNKNNIEERELIITINEFLEKYGYLDTAATEEITIQLDKTTTDNSPLLFSSQRGSQNSVDLENLAFLDRFSTIEQNNEIPIVEKHKCCNVM